MEIPKNLIILGPQGSGKGTQAKLLQDKFGYVSIGTGDALREIAKTNTELGRKVHQTINVEGRLAEAELVAQVIEEKLKSLTPDQPIIIEGFPRTIRQYELMKEFWLKIGRGEYTSLFIELSEDEAVKRLSTRFICESCGEIYIGNPEVCKKCGGKVYQREDDKPEAVRMRLKLFNQETLPVLKEMEKETGVIRINGAPAIEEVYQEALGKLNLL